MSEVERTAEEAYLYAYPMLVAYGFFHRQALGPDAPEKQALNRLTHFRTLSSPTLNNTIPWVNTDTLYSAVWLDLRAEPMVLTTPDFPAHRFQNIQACDWQTMAFLTRGTRDVGNGARTYLFAGPDWTGEVPAGVDEVVRPESWIVKLFARVLVEHPGDEAAIHALQNQYRLQPLSAWRGVDGPPPPPEDFPTPDKDGFVGPFFEVPSPAFLGWLDALMRWTTIHPSEEALFARFAALKDADPAAIQRGVDSARQKIAARLAHLDDPINGWVYPLDLRGGRDVLAGSPDAFLRRAVLAKYAIWGPPAAEVVYMTAETDADGEPLDGAHRYTLAFDRAPPVTGFWSFTVYDARTRLLAPHPSGRYKLGDRDTLIRDENGAITLHIQHDAPAEALRPNWLPVPEGPFQVVGRLYSPLPEILDKRWLPPAITRVWS